MSHTYIRGIDFIFYFFEQNEGVIAIYATFKWHKENILKLLILVFDPKYIICRSWGCL